MGSDAIWHTYKNQISKLWLTKQIPNEVYDFLNNGATIGAYIKFSKKIDGKFTINQVRGINSLIEDKFDLTLECIRLLYLKKESPLYYTLLRYKSFFDLFESFTGFVNFLLLNDFVDENQNIDRKSVV